MNIFISPKSAALILGLLKAATHEPSGQTVRRLVCPGLNTTMLHKTQNAKSETLETLKNEKRKDINTSHAINNHKE